MTLSFLHEISRNDLSSRQDVEFLREYNHNNVDDRSNESNQRDENKGVYFAENLTVPVRMTLLSPDDDFRNAPQTSSLDNTDHYDCNKQTCFLCCYLRTNEGAMIFESLASGDSDMAKRNLALDLITKFLFMINVDKAKLKKLISLRKYHPAVFNFCFFYLVFTRYLSAYRLKFHVRKCVQELFYDIFRINPSLVEK